MEENFELMKKQIKNNVIESKPKYEIIQKVLFIQSVPCIRTNKVAKALSQKGIQVDILYSDLHPSQVYKDLKLPYKNIYQLKNVNQMIDFINDSDYDILYSSNEPDYLTVLFTVTNKPIIHDTHDMMSLRADIDNEQIVLEYIANVKCTGNIYVNPMIRDIAVNKFNLKNKPILSLHSYIEKEQLPSKYCEKLSEKDSQIHCVFEGGLHGTKGHHRYLEPIFLKLAENHIHVHLHCPVDKNYIKELLKKSEYIHYEGVTSPQNLIVEMTKYDIGLAIFNLTERNKTFLDTAFPNKVWDYLAAGLPIMFANLISFKNFSEENGVGKVLDLNKDIQAQAKEISKIKIDKDILKRKKWLMNEVAEDIIDFLGEVKLVYERNNIQYIDKINFDGSDMYDEIYKVGGYNKAYFKHYSETLYINIWNKALQFIKGIESPKIIDIGCGPGQFANLLFDNNIFDYKGIDYSKEAIKIAKTLNSTLSSNFYIDNAYTSSIFMEEYNIVTLFEVLEHMDEDIKIINRIKKGAVVLFSVPNYMSKGHVRYFSSKDEISNRYNSTVDIKEIHEFYITETNIIYLAIGKKL